MNFTDLSRSWLEVHEGLRLEPYKCSAGKLTIGYGHNMESSDTPITLIRGKITEDNADLLLNHDIMFAVKDVSFLCDIEPLSEVRKAVLVDMAFNLGRSRLSKFKNMFAAIADGDFERAAYEMMDSRWSRQVGKRATFLAKRMETGL